MAWIVGEKLNYSCHIPTDQNAHCSVRAQWDTHSPHAGEPSTFTPALTFRGKVQFGPSVPPISHLCTRAHPCDTPGSPATISSRVYLGMPHDASPGVERKNNYATTTIVMNTVVIILILCNNDIS